MPEPTLDKVTAFVTRRGPSSLELLLFRHPNAGIQIPGGTVEEGEAPEKAALREVREETGLHPVQMRRYIGVQETQLPAPRYIVCHQTLVYARPQVDSFDWATFRRGIEVRRLRQQNDFIQVTYREGNRFPDPDYITYQITGWVPQEALCQTIRRHFYHLTTNAQTTETWTQRADCHVFRPFWAPLAELPAIVAPQNGWLPYVQDQLGYRFEID